jgi:DNA-binding NarL/FixJ family response regulator
MKDKITVVIVDDHPVFRRGLQMTIDSDEQLNIVAEAQNGKQAIETIKNNKPDVAVLDINMPELNGFETLRELRNLNVATEFIFLTMHKDEAMFNTAIDLGAKGYLLKESAVDDIVTGIKTVASGDHFISPALTEFLMNRQRRASSFAEKPGISDLTQTERKILTLIAEDKTSREIGDLLFISVRTVERHRQNICNKLEIHGSNSLLKFAVTNKAQLI